jgi:peptidoglycan/LPS O-acetylase OafA/YrhL
VETRKSLAYAAPANFSKPGVSEPGSAARSVFASDAPNLDYLRAFAVVLVLICHFTGTVGIRGFGAAGHFGVLIFFVHTTLVLMLSLRRLQAPVGNLFAEFYIRRVLRIYPLSIVTVLIAVLARYCSLSGPDLWSNLLLTMNLTKSDLAIIPLWSLPYEVQMYIFIPFLFLFAERFRSAWATGGLLVIAWLLAAIQPGISSRADIFQYVGCFLPGIAAYQLSWRPRFRWNAWLWPVALLVTIGLYAGGLTLWPHAVRNVRWASCLILGLALPQFRQMPNGWLRQIAKVTAKYSYGIYLMHMFALHIAFVVLARLPFAGRLGVFVAAMVVFPVVSYHLIEEPGVAVGKRLALALTRGRRSMPRAVTA